jgi:SAM-dependent methyltransferase
MSRIKSVLRIWALAFLYPRPFIGFLYVPKYFGALRAYRKLTPTTKICIADLQPCLGDWTVSTPFDPHYFYQGAWAARKLKQRAPENHVDIASSVLMVSVLSGFINTVFVDYRPLKANLSGLTSIPGDILSLPFAEGSVSSLSCLHVIEHIGLGRYGDPLDPLGSLKGALELQRILRQEGNLYISLPIGRERICFNAHRVHSPTSVLRLFSSLQLIDFSFVDDAGVFYENSQLDQANHLEYGCGLFHFQKQ